MGVMTGQEAFRDRRPSGRARATRCTLVGDRAIPVLVHAVSGSGAEVTTAARPPLGSRHRLHHPQAGTIPTKILAHRADGLSLAFDRSPAAIAFALGVMTAEG